MLQEVEEYIPEDNQMPKGPKTPKACCKKTPPKSLNSPVIELPTLDFPDLSTALLKARPMPPPSPQTPRPPPTKKNTRQRTKKAKEPIEED
jgi:hypothetical protein